MVVETNTGIWRIWEFGEIKEFGEDRNLENCEVVAAGRGEVAAGRGAVAAGRGALAVGRGAVAAGR